MHEEEITSRSKNDMTNTKTVTLTQTEIEVIRHALFNTPFFKEAILNKTEDSEQAQALLEKLSI